MNDLSDKALVEQYRSGNTAAFDILYQRYRSPVFTYIFRQVTQQAVAEDVYQDVWFKVIRSLDQWRSDKDFSPWLYRIAHNCLVDFWRKQQPGDVEPDETLQDNSPEPEHTQFIQNCIERLKALLGALKPDQRDAFVLQQESGLSLEQIAEVTASTRETVKSRLRYALKKIRAGLEGCDDE